MAEVVKKQYDLTALTISLDTQGREPQVKVKFDGPNVAKNATSGDQDESDSRRAPLDAFGFPSFITQKNSIGHGIDFTLPPEILNFIVEKVHALLEPNDPLWLHLVRPHGDLDIVPWEMLLEPALSRPLLRVPEFVVSTPRQRGHLNVVLCANPLKPTEQIDDPSEHIDESGKQFWVARELVKLVDRLFIATSGRITIDIFTDNLNIDGVREWLESREQLYAITNVHEPQSLMKYSADIRRVSDRLRNSWLLWIRDALGGRSVDMVHFLNHGVYSRDAGVIAFTEPPLENNTRYVSELVGATELSIFLNHVGAWSAGFTSPDSNYSEIGLRRLANSIAQMRPGPLFQHVPQLDTEDYDALETTYRFLFSPNKVMPPDSSSLILYCHPGLVAESRLEEAMLNDAGMIYATKGLNATHESGVLQAHQQISRQDGAYIRGRVDTYGGDFVGRDKSVFRDEIQGDKIDASNVSGSGIAIGKKVRQTRQVSDTASTTRGPTPASLPEETEQVWVESSNRYVEQRILELTKQIDAKADDDAQSTIQAHANTKAAVDALIEIQQIIQESASGNGARSPADTESAPTGDGEDRNPMEERNDINTGGGHTSAGV
ncbi:MAG: hypothetical protein AAF702_29090 [Chloroflexota bacterium]